MIKRLVFLLVVLSLAGLATAAELPDRDVLLTDDGTLYTVESVRVDDRRQLQLTVTHGENVTSTVVPATAATDYHSSPSLAYDADTDTLFLFWGRSGRSFSRQLMLASMNTEGEWTAPSVIDTREYDFNSNLRIGATRKLEDVDDHGNPVVLSELILHAVWWNENGDGESARYAMITLDKGRVASVTVRDLREFVAPGDVAPDSYAAPGEKNAVLRQPLLFPSQSRDRVDVVFGDVAANTLRRVTLKPVSKGGRIRVPIGVRGERLGVPQLAVGGDSASRLGGLAGDGRIALYVRGERAMTYATFDGATWSPARVVLLNDTISAEVAIDALRNLLSQ